MKSISLPVRRKLISFFIYSSCLIYLLLLSLPYLFQLLKYYLALEYYTSFGPHFKKALFNVQQQESAAVLVNVNQDFAKLLINNNMCLSSETVFVLFLEKENSYKKEKVSFSLTKRRQSVIIQLTSLPWYHRSMCRLMSLI